MNRRHFLTGSAAGVAGSLGYERCFGQGAKPAPGESAVAGTLKIDLNSSSHLIPLNYNGLSYELAQLTDPNFFAATNQELIALFRLLSPRGVLRLGGNSSETCWLKVDASTEPPEA